jgi:hypothetical protein
MTPRRLAWTLSSLSVALVLGAGACSDDHEHDDHTHQGTHDPVNPSCAAIMDICHEADIEPGEAHECHEIAHADVEAPCAAEKTRCLSVCEAVLADAGID